MARAGVFGSARVAPAAGGHVTATYQGEAGSTTDGTSYTFPAQPLGTTGPDRRIVVAVASRLITVGATVSAVTIGGVSATRDAGTWASAAFAEIWSAVVPSGATGDVVVTMSGTVSYCGLGVWTLTGGSPTGQTASAPTNTNGLSMSVTTAKDDVVIGVAGFRATSVGPKAAWNVATERYDGEVDGNIRMHTGADTVATVGSATDMGLVLSGFSTDSAACAAAYA